VTYIALLRGINVGGNKMVSMAELKAALTALGFSDVSTLLQSGNVVFTGKAARSAALEATLERDIAKRLGVTCDFHVRTADEWSAMIAANPFPAEAKADPGHLLVTFFKGPLDAARVKALQAAITGPERVRADGCHLYMTFPDGIGNSKAAVIAGKMLGPGTARNWNTVLKLAARVAP
jgi:uncharacterized protein (DUF1697 family)